MCATIADDVSLEELRAEAIEAAEDRIAALDGLLDGCRIGAVAANRALADVRQLAHSLKGLAATYDSQVLLKLSHSLEDYLAGRDAFDSRSLEGAQLYVDRMAEALDEHFDADEAAAEAYLARVQATLKARRP